MPPFSPRLPVPTLVPPPRHRPRHLTQALGATLCGLVLLATPVPHGHAQTLRTLDAVPSQTYALPSAPLGRALASFAVQAGIALAFDPGLTEGLTSPALAGHFTARAALDQLLAGSGLTLVARPDGSYTLRRPSDDAGGTGTLPAVRVTANTEREQARGPVSGYVARRSATATKTGTALIESPQSISVVSADEITDRKAESLDETLRYTAGVTPNSKPWAADLYSLLRGFELGNYGIFLDGLVNPNISYMAMVDPYGLERLEVLRGPASVLYGQMAPGGMVNAVSKRPTRETLREVGVDYGSYDRKQIKADFGGALNADGTLSYRLVALNRESGTRLDHDADDRVFLAPSLTWQPNAVTKLTLLAQYQKEDQSYAWPNQLQNPGALGQPDPGVNIGGHDNRWKRTNKMVGYEFEHQFDATWSLRQNFRYNDLVRIGTDVFPLELNTDGRTVRRAISPRRNDWEGTLLDTQVQAQLQTGEVQHTVLVGLDHARSQLTWTRRNANAMLADLDLYDPVYTPPQVLTPSATPYKDELPVRQTGLYVQEQLKWQRWVLTAGLRRDRVDQSQTRTYFDTGAKTVSYDQQSEATTGRAGLVYLFDQGWAPYVSYATSFAPETGDNVNGKPLSPSRGKQVEVGVRYQPEGQALSYTAAVFDLVRENVTTNAPGMTNVYVQTGEVASRGLELEARAALSPHLSVIAQYTYLDTEVTRSNNGDQGLALRGVPKHSASAWLRQSFDVDGLGLAYTALGIRHLGKARSAQDTNNENLSNPRLTLVDAALGIDGGAWRLSFNVNNLFDTQELIDCDGTFCYRSAERTASVSALFRF